MTVPDLYHHIWSELNDIYINKTPINFLHQFSNRFHSIYTRYQFYITFTYQYKFDNAIWIMYTIRDEVYTAQVEVHTAQVEVYTTQIEVHTTQVEVHTTQVEVYTTQVEVYTVQVDLHTAQVEMHTDQVEVHTAEDEVYTAEDEMYTDESYKLINSINYNHLPDKKAKNMAITLNCSYIINMRQVCSDHSCVSNGLSVYKSLIPDLRLHYAKAITYQRFGECTKKDIIFYFTN